MANRLGNPNELTFTGLDELSLRPTAPTISQSGLQNNASYIWDANALTWIKATGGAAAGSNVTVTNFPGTQPVSGTFFQTTQPVSIAATVPVSGTFFQTTQPVQGVAGGTPVPVSPPVASDSWGQSLSVTAASTATLVNIASSVAGYKITGLIAHGTGDGYFTVQVNAATVFSGRSRATLPTLIISLPNGISVVAGATVALKVTNESGSTADYDGTLLGA